MNRMAPVFLVCLWLPSAAHAQSTPDFSGTWAMDATRSASAVQNEPIRSQTLVIRQTATDLSIETRRDDKTGTVTYKFGKADNVNPRGPSLLVSNWYWDGPKLVTETVRNISESTVRTKEVHSLDASGSEMTIDMLLVVEHGYTLKDTKNYGSGKDIYRKMPQ